MNVRPESPYRWVLNPGAERELTPGATPDQRTVSQMRARSHLFDDLCAGEPRVWLEDLRVAADGGARGDRALLWCPTPAAVRICRSARLQPQAAPSVEILRRVLSKDFLGRALPEWTAPRHQSVHSLEEYLALRSSSAVSLRAKRLDGYAGKGQRTLPAEELPGDRLWIEHNLAHGGLVVEEELFPDAEFSVHGMITTAGVLLGQPCTLHIDGARAPAAVPTASPETPHAAEILRAGREAAQSLLRAGYFGPFGLDLILTRARLYASDLNARFTLGFSSGLGPDRDAALAALLALPPG